MSSDQEEKEERGAVIAEFGTAVDRAKVMHMRESNSSEAFFHLKFKRQKVLSAKIHDAFYADYAEVHIVGGYSSGFLAEGRRDGFYPRRGMPRRLMLERVHLFYPTLALPNKCSRTTTGSVLGLMLAQQVATAFDLLGKAIPYVNKSFDRWRGRAA